MKFDILKPLSTSGTGRKAIQEDSVFPALGEGTIHDKLFIVADGHGGDGKGFEASECFCQTVSDYFFQNTCPDEPFTDEMLDEALQGAASAMGRRCPDSQGTSFALLYLHRHGVMAAHVGSSCIFHVRPKERAILYRSASDIRSFVGGQERRVQPTRAHIVNVQYGDYFVLLTKGAAQCISDARLQEIICEPVNDNTKLMRMIRELSECPDNYSITIVHVSGVMNEAMDEHLVEDVVSAAVASQVASSVQGKEPEGREGVRRPMAESSDRKKENAGTSEAVPRKPKPQRKEQPIQPSRQSEREYRREKEDKSGFPVVLVTALLIVALGALAWWWMRRSTQHEDVETPAIEVKKDSVKKDTVNIMKGERPKAIELPEDKKNENKTEQPQKKTEEKPAETLPSDSGYMGPSGNYDDHVTQPRTESTTQPQQPQQPQQQQPAEEFKSEVTPISTPDPGTVTPRPVIPEGE